MGPDGSGDVWTEFTVDTDYLEYSGVYTLESKEIPNSDEYPPSC